MSYVVIDHFSSGQNLRPIQTARIAQEQPSAPQVMMALGYTRYFSDMHQKALVAKHREHTEKNQITS